jgi:hypothetical protein
MAAPAGGSFRGDTMLRMVGAAAAHDAATKSTAAFQLADLPHELADALRDYDLDGDISVSVAEIAMGAHLLRRQRQKARAECPWGAATGAGRRCRQHATAPRNRACECVGVEPWSRRSRAPHRRCARNS